MKYKYKKAFTIAELLVLLLVLSILLAAFAPVFSGRKTKNSTTSSVWEYLYNDENYNIVPNNVSDTLAGRYFIGLTPSGDAAAITASENAYAKLIIRSANSILGGKIQKQMKFDLPKSATNSSPQEYATIFAGNSNILVGGIYPNITSEAVKNTAIGYKALDSITTGYGNTAIGKNAGLGITSGYNNTYIVTNSATITGANGYNNTAIGRDVVITADGAHDNVLLSDSRSTSKLTVNSSYNTILHTDGRFDSSDGNGYNTLLNFNRNSNFNNFRYNTIILSDSGESDTPNLKDGSEYNTLIGMSASDLPNKKLKKITCIGKHACKNLTDSHFPDENSDIEAVFIGDATPYGGVAPLEVYNIPGTHSVKWGTERRWQDALYVHDEDGRFSSQIDHVFGSSSLYVTDEPYTFTTYPNSSVVINGNLIVRGQPYFMTRSPLYGGPALVGFTLIVPGDRSYNDGRAIDISNEYYTREDGYFPEFKSVDDGEFLYFSGLDGAGATHSMYADASGETSPQYSKRFTVHDKRGLRQNCTCSRQSFSSANPAASEDGTEAFRSYAWRYIDYVNKSDNAIEDSYIRSLQPRVLSYICAAPPKNKEGSNDVPVDNILKQCPKLYNVDSAGAPVVGGHYYDYSLGINHNTLDNKYQTVYYDTPVNGIPGLDRYKFPETNGVDTIRLFHYYAYGGTFGNSSLNLLNTNPFNAFRWPSLFNASIHNSAYVDYNMAWEVVLPHDRENFWGNNSTNGCCPPVSHPDSGYQLKNLGSSRYARGNYQKYAFKKVISDLRLKNILSPFNSGLDKIKKIKVYNFNFKNDKQKTPQVGVIAQDLRLIFPNAVKKNRYGFYEIRWEEMFYASINAVKELNQKILNLEARVEKDLARISELKKDNDSMIEQLNKLSDELDKYKSK